MDLCVKVSSEVLTASVPSYAPVTVECPEQPLLRLAGSAIGRNQTLSQAEANFRKGRRSVINPLWRQFFTNGPGRATGYGSTLFPTQNQEDWPVLGIAHSGGGLRASLYAAGVMQAFDARTTSSPVRGVYPLATYVTGLSGGSWLVASAAANNYPPVPEMVSGWDLEKDMVLPGGINVLRSTQFLDAIHDTVRLKQKAGYSVSLTDQWGRALSYHFLPGTTNENFYTNSPTTAHGAGLLFSGLKSTRRMQEFQIPLPIVVSNHKPLDESATNPSNVPVSGETYVPLSAPVYEVSPFEFGSYDPQLSAFIPTEFIGTSLNAGKPYVASPKARKIDLKNICVRGYDQLSFIIGSSATLFNAITGVPVQYTSVMSMMARKLSGVSLDKSLTARWPNPFMGVSGPSGFDRSRSNELLIVDGGENGENIPLNPLLTPARQIDVILAADASKDSNSTGLAKRNSMINTFLRVTRVLPAGTANFPPVPLDTKIWEQRDPLKLTRSLDSFAGFTSRPAFFGCEAPSKQGNGGYPLVIYLPNSPTPSLPQTNYSTYKLSYSKNETSSFLSSVMDSTTRPRIQTRQGDADWPPASPKDAQVSSQALTASVASYAPIMSECPSDQNILRLAGSPTGRNQTLSQGEEDFRRGRQSVTAPLWREFFTNGPGKDAGYQSTPLMDQKQQDWPVLGIAYSGGGLRAALHAAGVMQALDARTSSSPVRGVHQLASYVSALSGGSWMVGSAAANDYPIASELVSGWELEKDLVLPGGYNPIRNAQFLDHIHDTAKLKKDAGFNISLSDVWGRAVGYHFYRGQHRMLVSKITLVDFYTNSPATAHGAGDLFSGLRNMKSFQEFNVPLPIVVSDHKPAQPEGSQNSISATGATWIPLSAPVYEVSPFEFGSYDPQLSAFIPTEFLGTSLSSGRPWIPSTLKKSLQTDLKKSCVRGFDQLSFIMGSSATVFNVVTGMPATYNAVFKKMIQRIADKALDGSITARYPNPFKGVSGPMGFDRSSSDELVIVDGGENGENIPINPLLTPARQVDVILAVDASGDSTSSGPNGSGWPNGKGMINTYLRVHKVLPAGTADFPPVPLDTALLLRPEQHDLKLRDNFLSLRQGTPRVQHFLAVMPRARKEMVDIHCPSQSGYLTNTSTFKLQYSKEDANSFLNSVRETTTKPRIDNKVDNDWPTCLSCGLIDRSRNRSGIPRSSSCENCFKRYCYADDGN
ncbi:hypothetical protein PSTT_11267 [Puccinia striiformis]|uniref:Lysophospholipase n=1 Tax=Puccinia striiformis TaxID=27350 RepID=A0A2S4V0V7_9BASI|nr:hypothetical protein PSTT_11267 [Puccinia striiformis]